MSNTKTWGDYEVYLDQILGKGGMGAVYRGRQISVDRPVAVKVLSKDLTGAPDFVARFVREAKLVARIVDSHVVQVFGAGEADGEHFYVMEFVEGEDLSSQLKKGRRFNTDEILEIVIGVATALHHAWKFKIVHRDIKPSNVLVTRDREIKVMDFGLAKNPDMELTQNQLIMGTAKYISPEQATGADVDIRADIYSMGCMLFELATGRAPFVADSPTSMIYQHVHKAPVPPKNLNAAISDELNAMILRCMAKRPEERYQVPEEVISDARSLIDGGGLGEKTMIAVQKIQTDSERGTAVMPQPEMPSSRTAIYVSVAVAASILIVGGILVAGILGKTDPNKVVVLPSPSPTPTPTESKVPTPTPSPSESATPTPTPTVSTSPSETPTPSVTVSPSESPTPSTSISPTPVPTLTPTPTPTPTVTPTPEVGLTPTPSPTPTPSESPTPTPSVSMTPDPTPTDAPPDPSPEEKTYVRERELAEGHFSGARWSQAIDAYLRALASLPSGDSRRTEIASRLTSCRYLDAKERAEKFANDGRPAQAILAWEEARKQLADGDSRIGDIERTIRQLTWQVRSMTARQKMSDRDWTGAAEEWKRAQEVAAGTDAEEAAAFETFCRTYAEANTLYRSASNLERARKLYEELLKNPRSFEADIDAKLKDVIAQIDKTKNAAREAARRGFDELVRQGRVHFERAEWAKAKQALEEASQAGFDSADLAAYLPKARAAAMPPAGFVYIPGGKFTFGTGAASRSDGPEQQASTEAFYLGLREVTNAEYRLFLDANADHAKCHELEPAEKRQKGHVPDYWSPSLDPAKAVSCVDWFDAYAYAAWAGGRLPTEMEWEKAAGTNPATGARTLYPWGANSFDKERFEKNRELPGPNGCEGMGWGVIEWVNDWYDRYPGGTAKDLDFGQKRHSARGGIFLQDDAADDTRVTRRFKFLPDRRDRKIGFRMLKAIP